MNKPKFRVQEGDSCVVMFDVDGTLITYDDKPNYPVISLFHMFERAGCDMIIASGGGKDYAERWAEKLGLKARVYGKFDSEFTAIKLDLTFDDEGYNYGQFNFRV